MSRQEALQFINLAHFLDHFFLLIFPTAALAIAPAWGMTYSETLFLGTPVYVAFALGTLPAGWLGDRCDRMKLMTVFFAGCGLSSLLVAFSAGPLSLMTGLALLGLFASIYHPVGIALVTDLGMRTGRSLAVNGVFGNLGLAGSAVVTGILADHVGWQSAFAVPGAISTGIALVLFIRHRKAIDHSAPPVSQPRKPVVADSRNTLIAVFAVVCVSALFGGLIFNAVTISLPKYFDERLFGIAGDLTGIGASAGLVFAIAAFAQLPVGELLDRIGAKPVLLSLVSLQIVLLSGLSVATGWSALAGSLFLVTLLFGEIPVTGWLLGHYVRSGIRARAVSVQYVLSLGVGSAAVPVVAFMHGAGLGFGYQFCLLAGAAFAVFAAALFLPSQQPHPQPDPLRAPSGR